MIVQAQKMRNYSAARFLHLSDATTKALLPSPSKTQDARSGTPTMSSNYSEHQTNSLFTAIMYRCPEWSILERILPSTYRWLRQLRQEPIISDCSSTMATPTLDKS